MTRPRAVLFDWDNTLVDSWDTIHDAMGHCFTQMGREPWSLAEVKARTRLSLIEAFPPIFGERWQEARQHLFRPFPRDPSRAHQAVARASRPARRAGGARRAARRCQQQDRRHFAPRRPSHFGWTPRFARLVGRRRRQRRQAGGGADPDGARSGRHVAWPSCLVYRRHRHRYAMCRQCRMSWRVAARTRFPAIPSSSDLPRR